MKNLRLADSVATLPIPGLEDALHATVDPDLDTVYVATETLLSAVNPATSEVTSSLPISSPPVGLQYLCDQQAVCLATRDGAMSLWQCGSEEVEVVGEVSQGLTSMTWSPDLELLVITTGSNTLIIMTREFDPLAEVPLIPADTSGEEVPVNVGWGKKETQFHGSAGKTAAQKKTVEMSSASAEDHGEPVVRWRGDGQFFVVSAIDPVTQARFLYTWSRECMFQSRSEPVDGLQHSLYWKPSGSLIASVQSNKQLKAQDVVFFEKNGLRHGEFRLPETPQSRLCVLELAWNMDSTVLAVHSREMDLSGTSQGSVLQLWTVSNYHWHLKQTLRHAEGVSLTQWHTEIPCKMLVVTRTGAVLSYTWSWVTNAGPHTGPGTLASVAVIDGTGLNVTPMRTMVVPPPMSAFTLQHPNPVNAVTFDQSPRSNDIAALMSDGRVAIWRYNCEQRSGSERPPTTVSGKLSAAGGEGFTARCQVPTLWGLCGVEGLEEENTITNVLWLCGDVFVLTSTSGEVSTVHSASLQDTQQQEQRSVLVVTSSHVCESRVVAACPSTGGDACVLQLSTGDVLLYTPATDCLLPFESNEQAVSLPSTCPHMATAQIGGQEVVLGLTDRFRFYINNSEFASNVTSFCVHSDFLLLTTLTHTVRCIAKNAKLCDLPDMTGNKPHPLDESVRRVERGSQVVTVVGDGTKLVLQMPRGNLETVHPRALVLATLQGLLDSNQILQAFTLMRKHRINMNLLYDHRPSTFMDNIDSIITQIQSVNYLNLFLTDLSDEDVTVTLYAASYADRQGGEVDGVKDGGNVTQSKVDLVCNAAIAAFRRLDKNKYLLPIITAHVRKTEPELEEALQLVWSLHGTPSNDGGGEGGSESGGGGEESVSAEAALKYLLFLVDVNSLYEAALGTYNFDLVMMVAQESQKDPKEYIPFLNELRRLEETYRYYTIDKYLKKYTKALEHICKCGDDHFEECVSLITEHKLYQKALRLVTPGSQKHKHLCSLYGVYLSSKNRHDEAGIMFIRAEEWESALQAFISAHDWRQAFCMAVKLEYSSNRMSELAVKLAGNLKGRQRYAEAAQVYEEYAQDSEEAVATLIEGCHWDEALRLMHKHQRLDLVETHLKEGLESQCEHHMEMLGEQRETFTRHRRRLQVVRANKEKEKLMMETTDYNDADADLFSDTTSMTGGSIASHRSHNSSRSTVFSKATGSSRSRRKAEQKKWSLKEGSVHEEFALVDALSQIIKNTDSIKEEVNKLMKTLIQFHYDESASQLQDTLSGFLADIQASLAGIWVYSGGDGGNVNLGPQTTSSAIAQAMQSGQKLTTDNEKLDPVLLVPPTLSKDLRWKLHIASHDDKS